MAIAALIMSIVSVVFTGWGLYYARQQTRYTREAINLSRDRELEPKLQAQVVEINPGMGMTYMLKLTSHGPKDYERVLVTLPPKQGIRFTAHQQGVASSISGELLKADGHSLIMAGTPLVWRVEMTAGEVPATSLRVECRAGEDVWTITVPIEDATQPKPPQLHI